MLGAALLLSLGASVACAAPGFTFKDLGTLGGTYSAAYAINDKGQIVGASSRSDQSTAAVLWDTGTMTAMTSLDGASYAWGINNAGQIVGSAQKLVDGIGYTANLYQAVTWNAGVLQELPTFFTGILDPMRGDAMEINSAGSIVGNVFYVASIWSGGSVSALDGVPGNHAFAQGINDSDQVVGYWYGINGGGGFFWSAGALTLLDGMALDVNNAGIVVGMSSSGSAYLWDGQGYTQLDDWTGGYPNAINEKNQVVGFAAGNGAMNGVLWDDGHFYGLDDLASDRGAWHIEYASDINELGQIVGYATNSDGEVHAFLLDPLSVPEPATAPLVAVALLGALGIRARRQSSPQRQEQRLRLVA